MRFSLRDSCATGPTNLTMPAMAWQVASTICRPGQTEWRGQILVAFRVHAVVQCLRDCSSSDSRLAIKYRNGKTCSVIQTSHRARWGSCIRNSPAIFSWWNEYAGFMVIVFSFIKLPSTILLVYLSVGTKGHTIGLYIYSPKAEHGTPHPMPGYFLTEMAEIFRKSWSDMACLRAWVEMHGGHTP